MLIPMISAAMSWSRIAMNARPIRLRIRFRVPTSAATTKNIRKKYISRCDAIATPRNDGRGISIDAWTPPEIQDRKSTRLNSSHDQISYAVFCLKKKTIDTRLIASVEEPAIVAVEAQRHLVGAGGRPGRRPEDTPVEHSVRKEDVSISMHDHAHA